MHACHAYTGQYTITHSVRYCNIVCLHSSLPLHAWCSHMLDPIMYWCFEAHTCMEPWPFVPGQSPYYYYLRHQMIFSAAFETSAYGMQAAAPVGSWQPANSRVTISTRSSECISDRLDAASADSQRRSVWIHFHTQFHQRALFACRLQT